MGHPGSRLGQQCDLVFVQVDTMCKPDVRPEPTQCFHQRNGALGKFLHAKALFIQRLGDVRVQRQPTLSCPEGGLLHFFPGYRKR